MVLGAPALAEGSVEKGGGDVTRPVTPAALAAFFALAELLTAVVFVTLLAPGTPIDAIWAIKPAEYQDLLLLRPASTLGFLVLAAAMGFALAGCSQRRHWGLNLAIAIFALNALGDAARALSGDVLEGLIGVVIAGVILWWLTRPNVRALFR